MLLTDAQTFPIERLSSKEGMSMIIKQNETIQRFDENISIRIYFIEKIS